MCGAEQDTALVLKRDKARLQEAAEDAAVAAATLAEVAAVVDHCGDTGTPLHEVATAYTQLQRRYPEDYLMYHLPSAALAQVLVLLRRRLCLSAPPGEHHV